MSRIADAMAWFKEEFGAEIKEAVKNTPFTLDLLTAVAYQETGYLWASLFDRIDRAELLKVCVGDTLDTPNRSAFPKNKAALLAVPKGDQMFSVARKALEHIGHYNASFGNIAHANPNKFCHGFGIFQFDIQFFLTQPGYFLNHEWYDFTKCLTHAIQELKAAMKRAYGAGKTTLTPTEMVYVAIAYNHGSVNTSGSFKQGHKDSSGKYYGELVWQYMQLAATIPEPEPVVPQDGPRVIFAKHLPTDATKWVFQAMKSAKFVTNHFELDKAEVESYLGKAISGGARQALRPLMDTSGVDYMINTTHLADAVNPRVYVFVGA